VSWPRYARERRGRRRPDPHVMTAGPSMSENNMRNTRVLRTVSDATLTTRSVATRVSVLTGRAG